MRALLLAAILLGQGPRLYAAQSSAAQFLNLGFGARALGMGEAYTAVADDISCVYYNPAGLAAGPEGRELSFSHAFHIQDTAVSQVGFMRRPYAAAITYFSAGEMEGRDASAALTGNFTARDVAVQVSRGFKLGPLDAGISGKIISQKIKSSGATSFAGDFGLLYRFKGTPYSAGVSLVNFGTKVKFEEESFPLPMKFKAGVAAKMAAAHMLLALDAEFPNDGPAAVRFGAEYRGLDGIALRLGYRTTTSGQRDAILGRGFGDSVSGVAGMYGFFAGAGLVYSAFTLDYALLPYGELGTAHRFSVGMKF
ncbi:MAG: PorV/PorQ family protein [Elusimicrobiales bacterium]|nr:PorV/PorQ family protein [Elusimicrobiales bacterium]